ncbi:bifunctional 4-hydroxy-2-oxoglutarate aldolase/2-dehydro-3-deoxy-phosphogluconate aldolase [Cryobacterium tepidiphilum]|uniref:2-dehydro-3-deoxyphosphogluconate aldolase n=1 Tax=Cryobacterium tepidiphilum TaxID=2486026 RepID=A0A3M8LQE1_9MICO|nr:bifunctional 4-hydroxy-2-oxoglutarate aldolase/2-dehydro-3-deoxy-phosphogluconate aldolase [Cryobacterium tepidiphilum]RNE66708.1 2-dehydro-3-deoxyphosphogluconate aldolase [Cryobacterium tepidiphilum]
MDTTAFFDEHLSKHPVMGIFRGLSATQTVELCEKAWAAGVQLIEVPIQSDDAIATLRAVIAAGADRGKLVGAGTVTSPALVRAAAEAGARFTVAPDLNEEVAREADRLGVAHLPGVATSTEIGKALGLGLVWQKMFPAAQLGADWAAAQHGPFPEVQFVATGGINAGNAQSFLDAGVRAVAVGSAFADPEQIRRLALLTAAS